MIKNISLGKKKISNLIKIKKPFLLIDSVIEIIPGKKGIGVKNLEKKDKYMKSHFIDIPIFPASLQIEMMLQTIVSVIYVNKKFNFKRSLITKMEVNFYSPIKKSGKIFSKIQIHKNFDLGFKASASLF